MGGGGRIQQQERVLKEKQEDTNESEALELPEKDLWIQTANNSQI